MEAFMLIAATFFGSLVGLTLVVAYALMVLALKDSTSNYDS